MQNNTKLEGILQRYDPDYYLKNNIIVMTTEKTLGEKRVRTSFNPSDNSVVQHIKERAAEFINYVNDNVQSTDGEGARLKALALTDIESAAMWAVKAATL